MHSVGLSLYISSYNNIILSCDFFTSSHHSPRMRYGLLVEIGGIPKVRKNSKLKDHNIKKKKTQACRTFDSKNCASHGCIMAKEDDCVLDETE